MAHGRKEDMGKAKPDLSIDINTHETAMESLESPNAIQNIIFSCFYFLRQFLIPQFLLLGKNSENTNVTFRWPPGC